MKNEMGGHVAHMGYLRNACKILSRELEREETDLKDLGEDGRVVFKWI
jgi:hypothetical protein